MPDTAFRMYFNGTSATREQLDRIERIVVTQEMDMLWEAEVVTQTTLDSSGAWQNRAEEFPVFMRVRIELTQDGGSSWVPLIEGPIARSDSDISAQPGGSEVRFIVRDDSVFLNRNETAHTYHYKTEKEIINTVLSEYQSEPGATATFTADIAPIPGDVPANAARRDTPMKFFRHLAQERGWHAYVLPAPQKGQPSKFCYQPKTRTPSTLPPLTLLGDDRTLQSLTVEANPEGPQATNAARLDMTNGQVVTVSATPDSQKFLAQLPAVESGKEAQRLADPRDGTRHKPDVTAAANTERSLYAFRVTGRVVPERYTGVLAPYQLITVLAGATGSSADYLLRKVTHTLSRNLYTQEFEALGDSLNRVGPPKPGPTIL